MAPIRHLKSGTSLGAAIPGRPIYLLDHHYKTNLQKMLSKNNDFRMYSGSDSGDPSDTGYNRLMSASQSTSNGTRTDRRSRLTTKRRQARGRSRDENETLVKHLKNDEMTLSREILVLDINDPEPQRSDLDYTTLNGELIFLLLFLKSREAFGRGRSEGRPSAVWLNRPRCRPIDD